LFFQPGVEIIEAVEPRRRHEKVPSPVADYAFDIAFVVALSRPTELVVEQIMRLQLGKNPGSLPLSITADLRHRDRGVVIQDRQRHPAEERKS
jgi:hypothetical protein